MPAGWRHRYESPYERVIRGAGGFADAGAVSSRSTDPGSPFGVAAAVFGLTALPFGTAMAAVYGDLTKGMVAGLLFGLFFGLAMIPFLRVTRSVVPVVDRGAFEKRLKIEMSELGYTPTTVEPDYLQFKAPNTAVLEVGPLKGIGSEGLSRVSVHLDEAEALFIGPRWMIRKIVSRI